MVFTCRLFGDNTAISTDTIRQVGLMKCSKLEQVPPTSDALVFHIERAIFQAREWWLAHEQQPNSPNSYDPNCGWEMKNDKLRPIITMTKEPIPD